MSKRIIPLLLAVTLAVACRHDGRTLYHHYEPTHGHAWAATDTLRFQLPPAPQDGQYACELSVRLHSSFPYTGVWLVAETRIDSVLAHRDTLFCPLPGRDAPDLRHGGVLQQHRQPLHPLRLHEGQQAEVVVYHHMRQQSVLGVSDVGVRMRNEK